ncbi:lipoate--protein ligase family protein [Mariniblastus fucicola]|uniref:Putative lipoate-protein ligase A n=1 Tax=Mariniblastus fucicola TaxID=980251 RepID=A0A5B9PB18_9BACT|nr:lipoate--protein ligase family protein [Mariniblastus fucicola]QEG21716.1 putative lipoate-protein ligase A [Mariniblastus fucicola]
MKLLDLTLSPVLNLSLDDALIESAEAADSHSEVLRLWEPESPMVVIGRSSPLEKEINIAHCHANDVPVFRRISGGQSIVTGPGCLMYAVLLDYRKRPELRMLDQAHDFAIRQLAGALSRVGIETEMKGTCDLTFKGRKFSGNALRCKRNWFLYHGTIILDDFDLDLISSCLGEPNRQPDYRHGRSHESFVTSIPASATDVKSALVKQWSATERFDSEPLAQAAALAEKLAAEKYADPDWLSKVP